MDEIELIERDEVDGEREVEEELDEVEEDEEGNAEDEGEGDEEEDEGEGDKGEVEGDEEEVEGEVDEDEEEGDEEEVEGEVDEDEEEGDEEEEVEEEAEGEVEEEEEGDDDEEEVEEKDEQTKEPVKKQLTECPVCCEPFNNSTRRAITCFACPSIACLQCLRRFILGLPGEAQCMGCKTKWDRGFMLGHFTLKFVKGEYKEHLEVYFLDREKALLPETQARITREIKVGELREERKKILEQLNKMDEKIREMATGQPTDVEKKQFTRACPSSDCRGFLSTAWVCGLCSTHVCSKCHEIKDSKTVAKGGKPHTCLKENVETAALLAKDTKPCPKCASLIYKIDGCDQMWCVQCKTGFSWKSGRIEMVVHNPHYYEWLRQQEGRGGTRRNPRDIPCGGLISLEQINFLLKNIAFPLPLELYWYILLAIATSSIIAMSLFALTGSSLNLGTMRISAISISKGIPIWRGWPRSFNSERSDGRGKLLSMMW